jgi:hypothetical protein
MDARKASRERQSLSCSEEAKMSTVKSIEDADRDHRTALSRCDKFIACEPLPADQPL